MLYSYGLLGVISIALLLLTKGWPLSRSVLRAEQVPMQRPDLRGTEREMELALTDLGSAHRAVQGQRETSSLNRGQHGVGAVRPRVVGRVKANDPRRLVPPRRSAKRRVPRK